MTRLDELERKVLGDARRSMEPTVADRYRVQAGLVGTGQLPLQSWDTPLSLVRERQDSGAVLKGPDAPSPVDESPVALRLDPVPSASAARSAPSEPGSVRRSLLGEAHKGAHKGALLGWIAGGLMGFGLGVAVTRGPSSAPPDVSPGSLAGASQAHRAASSSLGPGELRPMGMPEQPASPLSPIAPDSNDSTLEHDNSSNEKGASTKNQVPSANETSPSARRDRSSSPTHSQRSAVAAKPVGTGEPRSTLALELSMLQRARRALNRGNAPLALGIVHSLDERVPSGVLMEERSATRILSLCKQGSLHEARAHSSRFLALYPRSVYAERVRAGCDATLEGEQ